MLFPHGNGRLLRWSVKVKGERVSRDVSPTLSTNHTEFEVEAVC